MTKTTLDEENRNCVPYYKDYQMLITAKIVSEGNTIIDTANILGKSYKQFTNREKHVNLKDLKV